MVSRAVDFLVVDFLAVLLGAAFLEELHALR
ncbi:delta-aminolevulinic acid dehydratase [Synechococcus sp. WH 7805]|nr:delta-aminolevulinic acid dehydratase [Synechococcus sp. WH 7805]